MLNVKKYDWKTNISDVLDSLNNIDTSLFDKIIVMLREAKSFDCIGFL